MMNLLKPIVLVFGVLATLHVVAQTDPTECDQRVAKHDEIDNYFQEDEFDRTYAKTELDLMLNTQSKLDNYANGLTAAMAGIIAGVKLVSPASAIVLGVPVGEYIVFVKGRNANYRINLERYKILIDKQGNKNKETRNKNANNRRRAANTNCGTTRPGPDNGGSGGNVPDTGDLSDPLTGIGDAEPQPRDVDEGDIDRCLQLLDASQRDACLKALFE